MFQFSYLKDDQNEKVGIGHSQELLQEIEWEECDDVILGSHYFVGLREEGVDQFLLIVCDITVLSSLST